MFGDFFFQVTASELQKHWPILRFSIHFYPACYPYQWTTVNGSRAETTLFHYLGASFAAMRRQLFNFLAFNMFKVMITSVTPPLKGHSLCLCTVINFIGCFPNCKQTVFVTYMYLILQEKR